MREGSERNNPYTTNILFWKELRFGRPKQLDSNFITSTESDPLTQSVLSLYLITTGNMANNDITIKSVLAAAEDRFTQQNSKSLELYHEAVKCLPGGNTRSVLHTAPFPLFMKSGQGSQLTDEDGHT
jgi:hypothetical protein